MEEMDVLENNEVMQETTAETAEVVLPVETEEIATTAEETVEQPVAEEENPAEVEETAEEVTEPADEEVPVQTEPQLPVETTKKVVDKKKLGIMIGGAVAVLAVAFLIVFLTVIKPNKIYDQAVDALESGDFYECERLMAKIPDHKNIAELRRDLNVEKAKKHISNGELDLAETILADIPEDEETKTLKADIQYQRAAELVKAGEYNDALLILEKIPDHADGEQLKEQIKYANALAALEIGDYETAYDLFSQLGEYEDAAEQKEVVYYEALAFKSLFKIQTTLKNPASMRVTKVTFYKHKVTEGELNAIYEFNATNSYGGSLGAYGYDITLYDDSDGTGMISHSDYVSPSDYVDVLNQYLVDSIKGGTALDITVDVARMNRLLEGNASFKIDLPFAAGDEVEN